MPKPVPRQRKSKVRAREAASAPYVGPEDANVTEILPTSKAEKEERRRKLKEDLRGQQPKISSKKKKRLDHYIVCMTVGF